MPGLARELFGSNFMSVFDGSCKKKSFVSTVSNLKPPSADERASLQERVTEVDVNARCFN